MRSKGNVDGGYRVRYRGAAAQAKRGACRCVRLALRVGRRGALALLATTPATTERQGYAAIVTVAERVHRARASGPEQFFLAF